MTTTILQPNTDDVVVGGSNNDVSWFRQASIRQQGRRSMAAIEHAAANQSWPSAKATCVVPDRKARRSITTISSRRLRHRDGATLSKSIFNVTLSDLSDAAGLRFIDASLATGNVNIDAAGRENALEFDFTSKGLTATMW